MNPRNLFPDAREFPAGTRTAQDAAAAIGCEVGQIVKSLVFRRPDGTPLLVLCSGANRVDEGALGVEKADAAFVREHTGAAIGGVPPFGHPEPLETVVDSDLMRFDVVWAAAGTPTSVFPIEAAHIVRLTGGRVETVRADYSSSSSS